MEGQKYVIKKCLQWEGVAPFVHQPQPWKHRKLSLKQLSTNGATHISQQTVNFYSNAITPLNEDTELMYFAAVSMCNV